MVFAREEKVFGLDTYVFETNFLADQTQELSYLDTVNENYWN